MFKSSSKVNDWFGSAMGFHFLLAWIAWNGVSEDSLGCAGGGRGTQQVSIGVEDSLVPAEADWERQGCENGTDLFEVNAQTWVLAAPLSVDLVDDQHRVRHEVGLFDLSQGSPFTGLHITERAQHAHVLGVIVGSDQAHRTAAQVQALARLHHIGCCAVAIGAGQSSAAVGEDIEDHPCSSSYAIPPNSFSTELTPSKKHFSFSARAAGSFLGIPAG